MKAAERLRAEAEAIPANKPGADGYIARCKWVADWLIASTPGGRLPYGNSIPRWVQEAIKDEGGGK